MNEPKIVRKRARVWVPLGGDERERVLRALFDRGGALLGLGNREVQSALARLYAWRPDGWPQGYDCKSPRHAEKGDDEAPFLSEAYLYPLFGKDDARTLLALVRAVAKSVGYEGTP